VPFTLRSALPWLFAVLLGLAGLLFPRVSNQFAPWFFLSSALLLGVPHGACDPWVPGWVRHHPSRLPFLISFFIIYLSLSFLYLLIWRAFPLPSTIFFLCLTAWHWGTADASLEFSPGLRWLIFGLGRGALVMLAPFAFHWADTWSVILLMAPNAGLPPYTLSFIPALLLAIALNLLSNFTAQNWIETGLLILLFFFCPPLLSVGTYFVAFHAWRHLLRLASLRKQIPPTAPTSLWIPPLIQLLLLSIPLTLASLAFLRWIPPFLASSFPSGQNWVGPYLILLAVLTLPHAILVAWMDKETLRS
jgi:Brp/Blh family beta-carotene 15,15'-monooxygenase